LIIGRDREKQRLNRIYASAESEFAVIYGRRRIGKTYLIREFFNKKKCIFFHVTGAQKESLDKQLLRFSAGLSKTFYDNAPLNITSWEEGFRLLNQQIEKNSSKKIVVFFDELPWLATRRSGVLQLLDYYWNHHWSTLKNVILVACGSSSSWLIKNIINNKGGLHNRVTCEIRLLPFSLYETKEFLKYRKIKLTNKHILLLYMALGGIPYYLKYVEPGLTADQNIQNIFFNEYSPLKEEFKKLFSSLFNKADAYIELIKLVAEKKSGITRAEIEEKVKLSTNGGRLTERLKDLCYAGFIEEKIAWKKKRGEYYRLIDEFCLFQLRWVLPFQTAKFADNHWILMNKEQGYKSWSGYAFEDVCIKHASQIIAAAKIDSAKFIYSWQFIPKKGVVENGAQIDLLVERSDDAITLFEIKFTNEPFIIDKQYAKNLQNKIDVFKKKTKTEKNLFMVMVSANGIKETMYSEEMINAVVTLDDLFKSI